MRKTRFKLSAAQHREGARRAKAAFVRSWVEEAALDGHRVHADEVLGDGGQDQGEAEAADSGKFGAVLRRGGYRKVMTAKSGHRVYEGPDGHRVWLKGDECYAKTAEGAKRYFSDERELEAGMARKRESIRQFFRRYAREV